MKFGQVLIETLWNVKTDINVAARAEELSINRNIMECKERRRFGQFRTCRVVIFRNLWKLKKVVEYVLLNWILLETNCPYKVLV